MKTALLLLSASTLLHSAALETTEEFTLAPTPIELTTPEVIQGYDAIAPFQQPLRSDDILPNAPVKPEKHKSAFVAVGLSYLLPGLGHTYLGEYKTAVGLFTTAGIGFGIAAAPIRHNHITDFEDGFALLSNVWSYGIFAAYRDVRQYNNNFGYTYKMPTDTLADLSYAPFNYKVIKKAEVWGGLLGAMALATAVSYIGYHDMPDAKATLSSGSKISPLTALPVGIGEETFFRGFLQSLLSESVTPAGGIILSSLAFGAAHIGNAQALDEDQRWRYYTFSVPLITTLGAYFGYLTQKNHSLKESVAIHTWYDFILFAANAYAAKITTGRSDLALAVPF